MNGKAEGVVVERSSRLKADADTVWVRAATIEGVNAELSPLVRMSAPRGASLADVRPDQYGKPLFASWLMAFGFIPFDRHVMIIEEVGERAFRERSHSMMQRMWLHERSVVPDGTGCVLTDRVEVIPHLSFSRGSTGWLVRGLFDHRHKRLRKLYGG